MVNAPVASHRPGRLARRVAVNTLDRRRSWSYARYISWRQAAAAMIFLWAAAPAPAHAAEASCRASAARSSNLQQTTFEAVVANPGATPCVSESHEFVGVSSDGGLSITDPRAATELAAGTLSASASVDSAAFSDVAGISVGHVTVKQVESCVGGMNVASGSSSVDGLIVDGTPISVVGDQSIDQTVAGVSIRTNQLSGDTRRGLVLEDGSSEYVLGEASAGGDVCAAPNSGGGEAPPAADGASAGGGEGGAGLPRAFASGLGGVLASRVAASRLALQCSEREITLLDVLQRGSRVDLLGAANTTLAGRTVTITLLASHKRVATAVVEPDGFFGTTAALPALRLRSTNSARYQASIGTLHSAYLKLTRRMLVDAITSNGGKVTISGRVIRPLAQPAAPVLIKRRISCSSTVTVKRIKPRSNGAFTVKVPAPADAAAALYFATTVVRKTVHSRKTYPTSTLPSIVVIR